MNSKVIFLQFLQFFTAACREWMTHTLPSCSIWPRNSTPSGKSTASNITCPSVMPRTPTSNIISFCCWNKLRHQSCSFRVKGYSMRTCSVRLLPRRYAVYSTVWGSMIVGCLKDVTRLYRHEQNKLEPSEAVYHEVDDGKSFMSTM